MLRLFFICATAAAQPQNLFQQGASTAAAVAPSTATAVSASTATVAAPEAEGHGLKVAGEAPTAILKNPISVHVHKEARDWEPVSVRVGGDPGSASNSFRWRISKKGGLSSKATAVARLHKVKDDELLVIALYPASLKKRGIFAEVRFLVTEGFLEGLKVAAITVPPSARFEWGKDDTMTLQKKGVEFGEDFPAEGTLTVSALSLKAGKGTRNSGRVSGADFGGKSYGKDDLKTVTFSYSAVGVSR